MLFPENQRTANSEGRAFHRGRAGTKTESCTVMTWHTQRRHCTLREGVLTVGPRVPVGGHPGGVSLRVEGTGRGVGLVGGHGLGGVAVGLEVRSPGLVSLVPVAGGLGVVPAASPTRIKLHMDFPPVKTSSDDPLYVPTPAPHYAGPQCVLMDGLTLHDSSNQLTYPDKTHTCTQTLCTTWPPWPPAVLRSKGTCAGTVPVYLGLTAPIKQHERTYMEYGSLRSIWGMTMKSMSAHINHASDNAT